MAGPSLLVDKSIMNPALLCPLERTLDYMRGMGIGSETVRIVVNHEYDRASSWGTGDWFDWDDELSYSWADGREWSQ